MKISASVIVGVLQLVWPLIADEVKEAAEKTGTKWDDRGVKLLDLLLGRIDPADLDAEDLIGYLVSILQEVRPELLEDSEKLAALIQINAMTDK